jgi:hypothetical protein
VVHCFAVRRRSAERFAMSRGGAPTSVQCADGSIALLGSPSTTRLGPTLRTSRGCVNERPASFTFVLADGRGDSIDIEIMGPTDLLSELVEILDDGVPAFHDDLLAGSSSGVQIIGGLRPSERQTSSIVPRIVAFARCLQFHVSRYVTWWAAATPMWNASTVAFSGKAPCRTNAFASRVAESVSERTGMPRSARRRRARKTRSPAVASSSTSCETRNWYAVRPRHQARVNV